MDIGDSVQGAFDGFFAFLPNLLGFIVILIVGYIVARVVAGVVRKVLDKMGLDRHLQSSDANKYVDRVLPGASATRGIARVVFWLVFVFFLFAAIGALKIPAVTTFMNQVLAYLPNIIAAILIFVVAALIAGAVAGAVTNFMGDTPTGKVVASVVPAIVMVIALFMILNQLKIAEEIVTIAFAAVMGALALGLALAFGLGGRDVARRLLEDAYVRGQQATAQVKQDARLGAARAQSAAHDTAYEDESSPAYTGAGAHAGSTGTDYSGGTTETGFSGGTTGTGYPER
jgi:small-conductance mechanosensitive channel